MIHDLLNQLKERQIKLFVKEGKLEIEAPKGAVTRELLELIKANKEALISAINTMANSKSFAIEPVAVQNTYALSHTQKRFWVSEIIEQNESTYHISAVFSIKGTLFPDRLTTAFHLLVERHEILRTLFDKDENGLPYQKVLPFNAADYILDTADFSHSPNAETDSQKLIEQKLKNKFQLDQLPLIRLGLYKLSDDHWHLYFGMHHIIADGWSVPILIQELLEAYKNYNAPNRLEKLRIQYKDFAAWQNQLLASEKREAFQHFWKNNLGTERVRLNFPTQKPRPAQRANAGKIYSRQLPIDLLEKIRAYGKTNKGSLFVTLLSGISTIWYRYTYQKEFIVGTPIAGRNHQDLSNQIGPYINLLPLKIEVLPEASFSNLFKQTKKTVDEVFAHQEYPFDLIVADLNEKADASHAPLFDVMISLREQFESEAAIGWDEDWSITPLPMAHEVSRYDLTFNFVQQADQLFLNIEYRTDLFDDSFIESFGDHFIALFGQLISADHLTIGEVNYLNSEKEFLLSQPLVEPTTPNTMIALISDQAQRTPQQVAASDKTGQLTYQQLFDLAGQFANYLSQEAKVGKGDFVIVRLPHALPAIWSLLALMKSGAIYVPVDPTYPSGRMDFVEQDCAAKFVIDQEVIQSFLQTKDQYATTFSNPVFLPEDLVYLIYTSGSTGQPKGVLLTQQNLYTHAAVIQEQVIDRSKEIRMLNHASYSFDISLFEIFTPLLSGGEIVIVNRYDILESDLQKDLLLRLTHIEGVPSFFDQLIGAVPEADRLELFQNVQQVYIGGDAVLTAHLLRLDRWFPNAVINELYGPTETTIWCAIKVYDLNLENRTAFLNGRIIGQAVSGHELFLFDDYLHPVPDWVTAELYIGGSGVAKGYLNRQELSDSHFIEHPYQKGSRLYKTGDLARRWPNGDIEFVGRKDQQVKINGYRIELGEIEQALLAYPGIEEVVLSVVSRDSGNKELVAYFVAAPLPNIADLRNQLLTKLPKYMLPGHFVPLKEMPLSANGKVDRKALPDITSLTIANETDYVAPSTPEEKLLAAVWQEVLKKKNIGAQDNFYSLGGDSIKSIQIVSRVKQQGYSIKIEDVLRMPVLAEQATLVVQNHTVTDQSAVVGDLELTPIQHFFFKSHSHAIHHNNQSVLLKSKVPLDPLLLERCLTQLVQHHDALRIVFKKEGENWRAYNRDITAQSYALYFYDLRQETAALEAMGHLGNKLQASLNIEEGPLLKVGHFRTNTGDYLALIVHHLVVDGVSWRILLEDFSNLYEAFQKGAKIALPLKTDSYQRWSFLQKELANGAELANEKNYWRSVCQQNIPSFPQDKRTDKKTVVRDASISFTLPESTTTLLQTQVHRVYQTEVNDILLTALGLALQTALDVDKVVLQMEGHGREALVPGIDISRTVGWFTSIYPFVLDCSRSADPIENLMETKEALRKIPRKGIGYGMLRYLSDDFNEAIDPTIVFNYLGEFNPSTEGEAAALWEFSSEYIGDNSQKENTTTHLLEVSGILVAGELSISVKYAPSIYDAATIQGLVDSYEKHLTDLIETLGNSQERRITPSDLTYKNISVADLATINQDNNIEDIYPLAPLQEGIYYHWLSNGSSSLYLEQMSYRIKGGSIHIDQLKKAYDQLIARHAVLRTSFINHLGGVVLQVVRKTVPSNFTYKKLSEAESKAEKEAYIEVIKSRDRAQGFDLEKGHSQMRLLVLNLGNGEYEFIWSHHHILTDGWCMSILLNDFYQIWNAIQAGETAKLPAPVPYADYIQWLGKIDAKVSLRYWNELLKDYSEVAALPFKINTETDGTFKESKERLRVEGELYNKVNVLCEDLGITQNTFVQGIWAYLLSKYNNTRDVVFGAVVSGRPGDLTGVENMIGLFINTIPVRVKYEATHRPKDLLKAVQQQSISSNPHHYLNLSEVQSQNELGMDLINHILVFENYPTQELVKGHIEKQKAQALTVQAVEVFEQNNYDFSLVIAPSSESMLVDFKYNPGVYDGAAIKKMARHFYKLVETFSYDPEKPLKEIQYLDKAELEELQYSFNDTAVDYPKDQSILQLFEEQVAAKGKQIAIITEDGSYSFEELNGLANNYARYLAKEWNIQNGDRVVLALEHSHHLMAVLLAVRKIGAVYVPVDRETPEERIQFIYKDSESKIVIDQEVLDRMIANGNLVGENTLEPTDPKDPDFIIYTSGSTGRPKGVLLKSSGILNRLHWMWNSYPFEANEVCCAKTSIGFVDHIWELFGPLLQGIPSVFFKKETVLDIVPFIERLSAEKVSRIVLVPSLLRALLLYPDLCREKLSKLRLWTSSGETLMSKDVELFYSIFKNTNSRLLNIYGSTEVTADATCYDTYPEFTTTQKTLAPSIKNIPIGRPIANTRIYLLDQFLQTVPVGVVGEICIAGEGVASAYIHPDPDAEQVFVDHPFVAGERLFRTGDAGKWLPDGNIEFVRRKDDQIKIRGHRIELREIESTLLLHHGIAETLILAKENTLGETVLVAYFTSPKVPDKLSLKSHLKEYLPGYMVPEYFVQLEAFPLLTNGKINKQLIAKMDIGTRERLAYVAPKNEIEHQLVAIWEELLGVEKIGMKDDFFELGGHSIKAIKILAKLNKELDLNIDIKMVLTHTVLSDFAAYVDFTIKQKEKFPQHNYKAIPAIPTAVDYLASDAQRRLWVLCQFEEGSIAYNMPFSIELKNVDTSIFEKAIMATIERHEVLRTVFRINESGQLRQVVLPIEDLKFIVDHLDFRGQENKEAKVAAHLKKSASTHFDLENGPLIKVSTLQVSDEDFIVCYNIHHIISDGWSLEVLSRDVGVYYEAFQTQKKVELPPLGIQYKDYAAWQSAQLEGPVYLQLQDYWLTKLATPLPLINLPTETSRPKVKSYNGRVLSTYVSSEITSRLRSYGQREQGSLFLGLLAVWNILLSRYTAQSDILIGTAVAGRNHSNLEDQIGFYINILALRNKIDPEDSFKTFYHQIKESMLSDFAHQQYPFDHLVEDLNLIRDTSRSAIVDVMLGLQNKENDAPEVFLKKEIVDQIIDKEPRKSKFDIEIEFKEIGEYLRFDIVFNSDVYERSMVESLMKHYKQLLGKILDAPEKKIKEYQFITTQEQDLLLHAFNDSQKTPNKDTNILDLFAEQVKKHPQEKALVFAGKAWTYSQLDERSNQLAHYLKTHREVKVQDLIGISLERNEDLIIALLAVLKTGAAYLPIDLDLPEERFNYIKKDSHYKLLIDAVFIAQFKKEKLQSSGDAVPIDIAPNDLCYVIYTSGTTGMPKGVMIQHRNVVAFIANMESRFGLLDFKKIAVTTNVTFDISVLEIIGGLCTGKELHLFSKEELIDPPKFMDRLEQASIEILQLTPSRLTQLYEATPGFPQNLRVLLVGGEAMSHLLYERLKQESFESINVYGPTEATIWSTALDIKSSEKLSIGRPLEGEQIYILDSHHHLQAIGVWGELYIAGTGLARGYLNRPELTEEKFIPNPFDATEKLYRTGDLARWMPNGTLEFLGRTDSQVKIRGHRIELGEIEYHLQKYPAIDRAIIIAKENELAAYFTANAPLNASELRTFLGKFLPSYMLPAYFVQLDAFALNASGKVDKKALPNPEGLGIASGKVYVAPRSEVEKILVKAWSKLLRLSADGIGVKDDFFALGGDSLKSVQLLNQLKPLGFNLKLENILRAPVLEELALLVKPNSKTIATPGLSKTDNKQFKKDQIKLDWAVCSNFNFIAADAPDLFVIHEGTGELLGYRHLFAGLKNDYNIWGFQLDRENLAPVDVTPQEMAIAYAQVIEDLYDEGRPVHLLGWSYGGYIAYLIANYFENKNRKIAQLTMIDTPSYETREYGGDYQKEYFTENYKLAIAQERRLVKDCFPTMDQSDFSEIKTIDDFWGKVEMKIREQAHDLVIPPFWKEQFEPFLTTLDTFQIVKKINQLRTIGLHIPTVHKTPVTITPTTYVKAKNASLVNQDFWEDLNLAPFQTMEIEGGHGSMMDAANVKPLAEYLATLKKASFSLQ